MILSLTADGSHTVFSEQLKASYHSIHGAIQETEHVFIHAGMRHILSRFPRDINILEIGFGTGLNALMTFLESERHFEHTHLHLPIINYHTVEAYPLSMEHVFQLNYIELLKADIYKDVFTKMHSCEWFVEYALNDRFNFQKSFMHFEDIEIQNQYDIIYFDAFAPDVQPHLWSENFLQKMYNSLRNNGILTTYCAKGSVKRTLKVVGFSVEGIPGPPGKREMTRAHKK